MVLQAADSQIKKGW